MINVDDGEGKGMGPDEDGEGKGMGPDEDGEGKGERKGRGGGDGEGKGMGPDGEGKGEGKGGEGKGGDGTNCRCVKRERDEGDTESDDEPDSGPDSGPNSDIELLSCVPEGTYDWGRPANGRRGMEMGGEEYQAQSAAVKEAALWNRLTEVPKAVC